MRILSADAEQNVNAAMMLRAVRKVHCWWDTSMRPTTTARPSPDIARYLLMPCTPVFPVPTNADESKAWSSMCLRENWISCKKDYEQFWIASPVMMWAQMAQYSTLEELAAIGASLMSRDKRRRMATLQGFRYLLGNQSAVHRS